eukprot:scaffold45829_cov57-Phaeocystis_antarctica.AAC.3
MRKAAQAARDPGGRRAARRPACQTTTRARRSAAAAVVAAAARAAAAMTAAQAAAPLRAGAWVPPPRPRRYRRPATAVPRPWALPTLVPHPPPPPPRARGHGVGRRGRDWRERRVEGSVGPHPWSPTGRLARVDGRRGRERDGRFGSRLPERATAAHELTRDVVRRRVGRMVSAPRDRTAERAKAPPNAAEHRGSVARWPSAPLLAKSEWPPSFKRSRLGGSN